MVSRAEVMAAMIATGEEAAWVSSELQQTHDPKHEFIPSVVGKPPNGGDAGSIARGVVWALRLHFVQPEELPENRDYVLAPRVITGDGPPVRSLAIWVRRPNDEK